MKNIVQNSSLDELQKYLDQGLDEKQWYDLLSYALQEENACMSSILLDYAKIPNNRRILEYSLNKASSEDNYCLLEILLEIEHIDINAKDYNGNTALIHAVKNGNLKILQKLLTHPSININAQNNELETALIVAVASKYNLITSHLLNTAGIDISIKDMFCYNALMHAISTGNNKLVQQLESLTKLELTAEEASVALIKASWAGDHRLMPFLLTIPNIQVNAKNGIGETCLTIAARMGHKEAVRQLLLIQDVEINAENHKGQTPLSVAAENGHYDIVKQLLAFNNIDVNAKNCTKDTPLHFASSKGHRKIVELLLNMPGIEPNAKNCGQENPLIFAAAGGHIEVLKQLLDMPGIDINAKDFRGETALMIATKYGHAKIVKILLDVPNIELSVINVHGENALSLAAKNDHLHIVGLISNMLSKEEIDFEKNKNILYKVSNKRIVKYLLYLGKILDGATAPDYHITRIQWLKRKNLFLGCEYGNEISDFLSNIEEILLSLQSDKSEKNISKIDLINASICGVQLPKDFITNYLGIGISKFLVIKNLMKASKLEKLMCGYNSYIFIYMLMIRKNLDFIFANMAFDIKTYILEFIIGPDISQIVKSVGSFEKISSTRSEYAKSSNLAEQESAAESLPSNNMPH